MQIYFAEISKYIIIIGMALYAFLCFFVFRYREEQARRGIYAFQTGLIFLLQFLLFITLVLRTKKTEYLFFYAFVQILLFSILVLTKLIYEKVNRLLLNNMCMLLGTGLLMLSRLAFKKAVKQYIIVAAAFCLSLLIPYLLKKFHFYRKIRWLYCGAGIFLLGAVLVLGNLTYGSKLSLRIPFDLFGASVSFHPSEFVKIIFLFFLAASLWEKADLKRVSATTVFAAAHVLILVLSRDLGSALIFFVAYVFMVFFATQNWLYLAGGMAGGACCSVAAYYLFSHVRTRVLAWWDPWSYIDNQGYQVTQSLFAIGSGSWFGLGLTEGIPEKIPFVDTDFIFSAICEELGVVFGLCVIFVCISCFLMMMNVSLRFTDKFYQLLAAGIGIIYITQIFLTVGGGIKFIPLTGVTLPFISYGGNSIAATTFLFFIIEGLYILRPNGVEEK